MKVKSILFISALPLIVCGGFLAPRDYPSVPMDLFYFAFLLGLIFLVIASTPRATFMMGKAAFKMVYGAGLFGAVLQAAYAEATKPTDVASLAQHMMFNLAVVTAIIHLVVWASTPRQKHQ